MITQIIKAGINSSCGLVRRLADASLHMVPRLASGHGLQADAQITQESLHKDGRGDEHGNGNKERAERVGNQVVKQNRCGRGTNGLGGKNEFLLLQAQDLAAHNSAIPTQYKRANTIRILMSGTQTC